MLELRLDVPSYTQTDKNQLAGYFLGENLAHSSQKHRMIDEYSQISSTKVTNSQKLTFCLSDTDIVLREI